MNVPLSSFLTQPRLQRLCLASALALYVAIVVIGSIPGARADIGAYASGPQLHSTAYAVLACLWYAGSNGSAAARSCKAILAIALMGAGDEFVQSFFPYRGSDIRDWAVDCISAIVTCALLSLLLAAQLKPATGKR